MGPLSRTNPTDDVWPVQVRCELILGSFGVSEAIAYLAADMGTKDRDIETDGEDTFPTEAARGVERMVMRIDDEWMEYTAVYSGGMRLSKRGIFGTKKSTHMSGAAIRTGIAFVRSFQIAASRNYWNR